MTDIIKLVKAVLRQYKIIIASTIFVAVLVFFFTKNMPKEYRSDAVVYTGIKTGVTPGSFEGGSMDRATSSATYDNLLNIMMSRETLKEVGLRLFAMHLTLKQANPAIISMEHLEGIRIGIPPDVRKLAGETDSITYQNILEVADTNPYLINIINYSAPYYSITSLTSTLGMGLLKSSDMIGVWYSCNDAGVCQKTLEILIDVSLRNYRKINETQTDKVVVYYEEQLKETLERLRKSEDRELRFKKANNIVDYSMQTGIAISQREDILNQMSREQETMLVTEASMKNIEGQMGGTQAQSLKNKDILAKREQLSRLSSQLSTAELSNASPEKIANLQSQINQVKTDLSRDMTEATSSVTTGSSLANPKNNDRAVSEYFSRVITYEESKARLRALEARRNAAVGQYSRFVPMGDTLKRIQREIAINEREYMTALDNLNQSKKKQQDQQSFSTVQVIDPPNYPLTSAPSKRKLLIMLGAIIGMMIPSSIFLGIEYFNGAMKTPLRAEQATGLKIGGIVPNMKKLQTAKNPEMISDGLSDTILKNLYMVDNQHGQQRVLIISTRQSEGKTIISNMLCERLIRKGKKCLVVVPYLDSGSWSVVSYKVDNAFYQSRAEDLVPVEKLNETDILILELPSLIMSDYPIALIKQFNIAFLVCDANREWTKADQTALDSFVKISGITPQLILNDVDLDVVEEVLGKISKRGIAV